MGKLKILMLHPYQSNAAEFKAEAQPIVDACEDVASFAFLEGPHMVDGEEGKKHWGLWGPSVQKDSGFDPTDILATASTISEAWADHGPFDGIWGCSQGACLTSILVSLLLRPDLKERLLPTLLLQPDPFATFRFAIINTGPSPKMLSYFKEVVEKDGEQGGFDVENVEGGGEKRTKTLFVFAKNDEELPVAMAEKFIALASEEAEVKWSEEGHKIPVQGEWPAFFREWISQFIEEEPAKGDDADWGC
ncbi:hypothetical protein BT69DRAFT_1276920 [Atractiella rhizophila]|nr:hypothetical protein BT69DRAFT_1276920 [Atractiella rhizophila]